MIVSVWDNDFGYIDIEQWIVCILREAFSLTILRPVRTHIDICITYVTILMENLSEPTTTTTKNKSFLPRSLYVYWKENKSTQKVFICGYIFWLYSFFYCLFFHLISTAQHCHPKFIRSCLSASLTRIYKLICNTRTRIHTHSHIDV